jgi:hypothetical protein
VRFPGLAKQNTTKSLSSWRNEYLSGVADRTPAAQNIPSLFTGSCTLSKRHVMRPFADRAVSFVAGTLNLLDGGSLIQQPRPRPSQTALLAILHLNVRADPFRRF